MNPTDVLTLLSQAVSVVQGLAELTHAYDDVANIVAKRIADKRADWSDQEKAQILDYLTEARNAAVSAVEGLPPDVE